MCLGILFKIHVFWQASLRSPLLLLVSPILCLLRYIWISTQRSVAVSRRAINLSSLPSNPKSSLSGSVQGWCVEIGVVVYRNLCDIICGVTVYPCTRQSYGASTLNRYPHKLRSKSRTCAKVSHTSLEFSLNTLYILYFGDVAAVQSLEFRRIACQ